MGLSDEDRTHDLWFTRQAYKALRNEEAPSIRLSTMEYFKKISSLTLSSAIIALISAVDKFEKFKVGNFYQIYKFW